MCEDVARTAHLARASGSRCRSQPDIDALYDRYQNVYGQHWSPMAAATRPRHRSAVRTDAVPYRPQ